MLPLGQEALRLLSLDKSEKTDKSRSGLWKIGSPTESGFQNNTNLMNLNTCLISTKLRKMAWIEPLVRAGPIWANLEPVGFIIPTFRSNLGVVGFININFLDPQNDRFLAFSPCKTAKRFQKNFRRASRAVKFLGWWVLLFQILRPISIRWFLLEGGVLLT